MELFKLLMQVVLIGHFFACLWMFVTIADSLGDALEDIPGPNWWRTENLNPHEPLVIYVNSVYVRAHKA